MHGLWGNREKLFTLTLIGAVVLTALVSGLLVADLTRGRSLVAVAGTGGQVTEATTESTATAGPGTGPATPGAAGTAAAVAPGATPGRSAGGGGHGATGGVPTVANVGVVGHTLLVGSIITLTGPGRSKTMADAVNAWVQDFNRRGGINGYTIKFDFRDDGGNADTGAAEYRDFAEGEHVLAVLGECAPITDEQQVNYVNQKQLLLVGECQSAPEAYHSPYIWVTGPTPYDNGRLGAKMMHAVKGWNGPVALLCLNDPSTLQVCYGARDEYKQLGVPLWNGGPHLEDITGNDYAQLISQWQSQGINQIHLVIEPGNTQRYLAAAAGANFNPQQFMGLVIDDSIAGPNAYRNATGMMVDTPWTPLDQNTPGMQRLTQTLQTYYPDDTVDLYAQTGWVNCLLFEHALQLMGNEVSKQNLIDTLNGIHNWDTGLGEVLNYSPSNHVGTVENSLMAVQDAGTPNWHFVTLHGPITL